MNKSKARRERAFRDKTERDVQRAYRKGLKRLWGEVRVVDEVTPLKTKKAS